VHRELHDEEKKEVKDETRKGERLWKENSLVCREKREQVGNTGVSKQ